MSGNAPDVSKANLDQEAGRVPTDPDQTWEDEPFVDDEGESVNDPTDINDGEPVTERGDE